MARSRLPARAVRYARSMRPPSPAHLIRAFLQEEAEFRREIFEALGDLEQTTNREDALGPKAFEKLVRVVGEKEAQRLRDAEPTRIRVRRKLDEISTGAGRVSAAVRETAVRTATHNLGEFRRVFDLDKQAGVSTVQIRSIQPGIAPAIDRFQTENAQLITKLHEETREQIRAAVDTAWSKGLRVEELRDQLAERFKVSESRAALIARDQVLKLNASITRTRQQTAGVRRYIWTTARDERVRGDPDGLYPKVGKHWRDHYSLDGKIFSWDAPPVVAWDGTTAHPGEDYQCRCVAFPVLEDGTEPEEPVEEEPPDIPFGAENYRPQLVEMGRVEELGGVSNAQFIRDKDSFREGSFTAVRRAYEGVSDPAVATEIATTKLPPVRLEIYSDTISLNDGRHRLAVAREYGASHILAKVNQYNEAGDLIAVRTSKVKI